MPNTLTVAEIERQYKLPRPMAQAVRIYVVNMERNGQTTDPHMLCRMVQRACRDLDLIPGMERYNA